MSEKEADKGHDVFLMPASAVGSCGAEIRIFSIYAEMQLSDADTKLMWHESNVHQVNQSKKR